MFLRNCIVLGLAPLFLAGCSSEPKCSSSEALKDLNQIINENVISTLAAGAASSGGKVDFAVEDVITTGQTERKAQCKYDLKVTMTPKDGAPKVFKMRELGQNPTYTVEKTDDGRLLVTAYGLK